MTQHTLKVGTTYPAEIRGQQRIISTDLSYSLDNLNVQSSTEDITTVGEMFRTFVAINRAMNFVGEASSTSDLSLRDVDEWLTRILRLFDVDPSTEQHWDSKITGVAPGTSARLWRIASQSVPFVAFS